jgi:hypothetical protein
MIIVDQTNCSSSTSSKAICKSLGVPKLLVIHDATAIQKYFAVLLLLPLLPPPLPLPSLKLFIKLSTNYFLFFPPQKSIVDI